MVWGTFFVCFLPSFLMWSHYNSGFTTGDYYRWFYLINKLLKMNIWKQLTFRPTFLPMEQHASTGLCSSSLKPLYFLQKPHIFIAVQGKRLQQCLCLSDCTTLGQKSFSQMSGQHSKKQSPESWCWIEVNYYLSACPHKLRDGASNHRLNKKYPLISHTSENQVIDRFHLTFYLFCMTLSCVAMGDDFPRLVLYISFGSRLLCVPMQKCCMCTALWEKQTP